jgi:exodeoxyribonuclease VII small subunit
MPANKKQPAAKSPGHPTGRPAGGPAGKPVGGPAGGDGDGTTFEEALERLETIVEELETGSLSLDQSLARYEEGMRLSRRLTGTLDQAEKRIERLVEEGGEPTTRPFERAASERAAGEPDADDEDTGEPAGREANDRSSGGEGELPF